MVATVAFPICDSSSASDIAESSGLRAKHKTVAPNIELVWGVMPVHMLGLGLPPKVQ